MSIFLTVYQAYLIFLVRSQIVDIRLHQFLNKNGYTQTSTPNNQLNLNVTNTETNVQNNKCSNIVALSPKDKVEIVDEKKPEVKFDRISKGAIARLSDKYKVTSTENTGSKTDTTKASATSSGNKDNAVKAIEEAVPSTSKDVKQEAKKTDDNKDIKTIPQEKENDEAKNVPVPKKRGLFRRSKSDK